MPGRVWALVVGGGAVGLSIARALSRHGKYCLLVEQNDLLGSETSSRSSEVLHAGLYYEPHSLKAQFCVSGRDMLIDYMHEKGVKFDLCGKLVVAGQSEKETLRALFENALRNKVRNLQFLTSSSAIAALEPNVVACEAILSPNSGIFDSHGVLSALEVDLRECANADIVTNCQFHSATRMNENEFQVETSLGSILCENLINAAGLCAPQVAYRVNGILVDSIPRPYYSKGTYFKPVEYAHQFPFRHLVYPIPSGGGLGVHSTMDLSGKVKFGPNTKFLESHGGNSPNITVNDPIGDSYQHDLANFPRFDYSVDEADAEYFKTQIMKYYPSISAATLQADYCGIRPKLCGPKSIKSKKRMTVDNQYHMELADDFVIHDQRHHRVASLISLYGIESPGWTSALAIADYVNQLVLRNSISS